MNCRLFVSFRTTDEDLETNDLRDSLTTTSTYSVFLVMGVRGKDGGSGGSGTEHANVKAQEVLARRTVLNTPLEEQKGDDTKTPPKLLLVLPVRPGGNVLEINPSIAKDENNADRHPGQPLRLAYKGNGSRKKRNPRIMVHSTKVPETTLTSDQRVRG